MNEPRLDHSEESEIRCTLVNFIEHRRVQTIPNILRRNRSSLRFNSIDRTSANFIRDRIEKLFNPEFGVIVNPVNVNNFKRVNCREHVDKKVRNRKQVICPKVLIYDDEDWNICDTQTLSEGDTEEMDISVNSESVYESDSERFFWSQYTDDYEDSLENKNFQDNTVFSKSYTDLKSPVINQNFHYNEIFYASQNLNDQKISHASFDNHRVSITSQDTDHISLPSLFSSLQSPLEFYDTNHNTNWIDIQSIIEVDMKHEDINVTKALSNDINSQSTEYLPEKNSNFCSPIKDNYSLPNSENRNTRHGCFMCNKTYKNKSSLRYHLTHIHKFYHQIPEVAKVLTCKWCLKEYRRINAYEKHLSTHIRKE